jgi:hypothetical protein
VTFWAALALSMLLLVRLRLRVELADLGLFLVMTLLALSAARFALFWAVALVPVWARWLEQAKPQDLFAWPAERRLPIGVVVPILVLGLGLVAAAPVMIHRQVMSSELPMDGIERLKEALPRGRIYNYREWGGPLILARFPDWQVAIDGRLYLYPLADWVRYNDASRGAVSLAELVTEYQPDAFFLRPSFHETLISQLRQSSDWREIFSDATCSIFVKAGVRDAGK